MHTNDLSTEGKKFFHNIEFDDQEKLVCEIKKHPFGLYGIYAGGVFSAITILAIFIGGGLLLKGQSGTDVVSGDSNITSVLTIFGGLLAIFILIMTSIGAYLYKHNVIIVTSQKIAQLLSKSIFNNKVSQLGIGDIQDVTVTQRGIFAHMFKYGTLVIETAGEQQNYTFTFAPDPYQCARNIITAREADIKLHGN